MISNAMLTTRLGLIRLKMYSFQNNIFYWPCDFMSTILLLYIRLMYMCRSILHIGKWLLVASVAYLLLQSQHKPKSACLISSVGSIIGICIARVSQKKRHQNFYPIVVEPITAFQKLGSIFAYTWYHRLGQC